MVKKYVLIRLSFYILFFLNSASQLFSQQVSFRQLSVKDGLSQNSAIAVTQDSLGFLWVATQDGLNKYDGRSFTTYDLQFSDITRPTYSHLGKLYLDRKNQLWALPLNKTPLKLNHETNKFDSIPGLKDVHTLYQDSFLNYWAATDKKELLFVDENFETISKIIWGKPLQNIINVIIQEDKNHLLLLSKNELTIVDIKQKTSVKWQPISKNSTAINANFSTIQIDSLGTQWIGSYGSGLFKREKGSNVLSRIDSDSFNQNIPLNANILALHIDSKKRLWVATYGDGLYMIDFTRKNISHFKNQKNNPKTLHYDDVLSIHEDNLGTLWFGTDGAGLSYYDEHLEKFNSYTNNQTTENVHIDVVRAIAVQKNGIVWVGTSGKGLSKFNPQNNQWQTLTTANSQITSNRIMSLYLDDSELWIGSQGEGIAILDSLGNSTPFNEKTSTYLSAKSVWDIFKDSKNRFWLATNQNGLIQFDKSRGEIKKYQHNLSENIRVITEDKRGNLWLGTDNNGVFEFNPEKETITPHVFKTNDSITVKSIKSVWYAKNDILWIGTYGYGLIAYSLDKKTYQFYDSSIGMANDVIYASLPDNEGNLWLSSNKGITKFTPKFSLSEPPEITNYTNYDRLATEFNTGAYYKSNDGQLYFGGLEGLYWFQPENIKKHTVVPKTVITGFKVSNKPHPLSQNINLESDQNTLDFTFSSLQYALPAKNEFKYRLVNHDKDWVFSGNNNYARYTQLPYGSYEFQVKSSNYDGLWNENPATFNFTIKTPWYATLFAKMAYVVLCLAFFTSIFYYYKWRWHMKLNLELKEKEALKLRELNEFKSNLYTDIAHEFKTPLTLIAGPIDKKLANGNLSDIDHSSLSMIQRNTHRLTVLVDQLLQLAQTEDNKIDLKIKKGHLSLFLYTLAQSFEYQSNTKNIDFQIQIPDIKDAWYDEDIIEKIVTNLLSNALKYSTENGWCHFKVNSVNNQIQIEVKNTAKDASKLKLDKIFTRFYQHSNFSEGVGIGLALVKELVRIYGGSIKVTLEANSILNFICTLPTNKAAFALNNLIANETSEKQLTDIIKNNKNTALPKNSHKELPILLIVEDHQEVRDFIKLAFENQYQIIEAENGKTGISLAQSKIPDIIISDVRMPLITGIELCNTLKNDERTSHIPIILLTAGLGEKNELKGLTSGADDFITKPFKINVLEQRMANQIALRKELRDRYSEELILKPKNISITPSEEKFFINIQRILDDNLNDPDFNASSFSTKANMSRMQLHRKLMAYTNLSTTAFLRSQRLKQAKQLLQTSDLTINEIAYSVGFNTTSYFIKCFKETFKSTPIVFQQAMK